MYLINFFICFVNSGGLGVSLTEEKGEILVRQFHQRNNQQWRFKQEIISGIFGHLRESFLNSSQITPWVVWGEKGFSLEAQF